MDLDQWREIGESLARHPLRTALTMGSVAWGTFVLVVLLGTGQGLQNSVRWEFRDDATNSIWIYRGQTSRPFAGTPVGRQIRFTNGDHEAIRGKIDAVDRMSSRFFLWDSQIRYRDRSSEYSVRSVHPDHQYLEQTIISSGRFIDDFDIRDKRKVAVIGKRVADFLFRGADPIGEYLTVAHVPFEVVGVFTDVGGEGEEEQVYLPISTAQATFGGYDRVHQMMFTVGDATTEEATTIADRVLSLLAERHHFDPEDPQAIRVRNNVEQFARVQRIFQLLSAFVWLVGVGTVTAGLVGVSNITLVSVRERTAEIALRKALGATPATIVSGIVLEAVGMTATSGYAGIVAGVAVLTALRAWMPENDYLRDPEIHLAPALFAAALLVVAGGMAGFVPAWIAARVPPVEGLRDG